MLEQTKEFYVFKPEDHEVIPIFCPICDFAMRTFDDIISFKEDKCCLECSNFFIKGKNELDKSSEKFRLYLKKRISQNNFSFDFK